MDTKIFSTPIETAQAFGDYLMTRIFESREFHVALSGGSTPQLLFVYLSEEYWDSDLWERVHFYWGDERCVPPDHSDSNYKMAKDLLFDHIDLPASNIHRVMGESDPEEEAIRYSSELTNHMTVTNNVPIFDMIILGMGGDGHTASIFPNQMHLLKSDAFCDVAIHPESGQKRVSLTGPVINQANEVVFLVTGEAKKEVIREIFNKDGKWEEYPASHIHPVTGRLTWFMDKAAGS